MTQATPHADLPPDPPVDALTDHEYDGIREYDNPTPGWWKMLFLLSFIFSIAYILVFHIGVGPSVHDDYEASTVKRMKQMFGQIGELQPDRPTLVKYMADEQWLKVGQAVYAGRCATCHGADASGTAAPNLTDDLFIHVRKLEDIANVVANGANNGAMPAWKTQLHINEIVLVSAYVATLRGHNLPTGSWGGATGTPIPPWTDQP